MTTCKKFAASVLFALSSATMASAAADVITFDDIDTVDFNPVHFNYHHFQWSNLYALNSLLPQYQGSGYANGMASFYNVAFNRAGEDAAFTSTSRFNLLSIEVTNAFASRDVPAHFDGYVGDRLVYSLDVMANAERPTHVVFGWTGVTRVVMRGNGNFDQTVLDNISVSAVPEAHSYALLLAGLGLLAFTARRRSL
ncbi:PEP-CTERM sorting domain-containing protein [Oxalobacteraceae bacterium]|nr:PEP-CTERM sorting domain-containing protein [Oxalobacteraceae bacterium]